MNWYEDPNILIPVSTLFSFVMFVVIMKRAGLWLDESLLDEDDSKPQAKQKP